MGAKHASIHVRTEEPLTILAELKKVCGKKKEMSQTDRAILKFLTAVTKKNIDALTDETERAEMQATTDVILGNYERLHSQGEKAVLVVRPHFVSLYWRDTIRVETLAQQLFEYAQKTKAPALGVAVYDDSNFVICAMRATSPADIEKCEGSYWFDENAIRPCDAKELCHILDADFLLAAMEQTLACNDGEAMAETFEQTTGLPILMDEDGCVRAGLAVHQVWGGATVFLSER